MARIDVLPSIEIIRGLKGILDFYMWRGLPCVRAWPTWRPTRQSDASKAAALTFGAIVKAYSLLANQALLAYREDALDQPRTARDIMVTGAYGNLHEASMSDFLDALIIIRDATITLTDLLHALHSDGSDHLDVDVHASVLPPLAATSTNQGLIYGRLGIIDDLPDALESNALDRLLVRGMDQLHSIAGILAQTRSAAISGNNGFVDSQPCPAGKLWCVTAVESNDHTTATTLHGYVLHKGGASFGLGETIGTFPALDNVYWNHLAWLGPTDVIRVYFTGGLAGDTCRVILTGHYMTLET